MNDCERQPYTEVKSNMKIKVRVQNKIENSDYIYFKKV